MPGNAKGKGFEKHGRTYQPDGYFQKNQSPRMLNVGERRGDLVDRQQAAHEGVEAAVIRVSAGLQEGEREPFVGLEDTGIE